VTRRIVFRPDASREFEQAVQKLQSENTAAAIGFLESVQRVLANLRTNPLQYQAIEGNIRRAPLRRFPYNVVYSVTELEVVIIACAHTARHPKFWRKRLR
jgi:plasmid stabilization system protein ParE